MPIILTNFVYKVIIKLIAARLKPLHQNIISTMHGAFVFGRSIFQNVHLAHACVHNIMNIPKN